MSYTARNVARATAGLPTEEASALRLAASRWATDANRPVVDPVEVAIRSGGRRAAIPKPYAKAVLRRSDLELAVRIGGQASKVGASTLFTS